VGTTGVRGRAQARRGDREQTNAIRPVLTGRAVLLVVVLAMLVLSLAVPARTVFAQRAQISGMRADNAAIAAQVASLQAEKDRLADPVYVQSLIRQQLHYVLPGQVGYFVLEPDPAAVSTSAPAGVTATSPWYDRLWSSVQEADGAPGSSADPTDHVTLRPDSPR
jgi:cell division protein FtsB